MSTQDRDQKLLKDTIEAFERGDGAVINERRREIVRWLRELRLTRLAIAGLEKTKEARS